MMHKTFINNLKLNLILCGLRQKIFKKGGGGGIPVTKT